MCSELKYISCTQTDFYAT